MEKEGGINMDRSRSIYETVVHKGVQSRCVLSTNLSDPLGNPRGLFWMIPRHGSATEAENKNVYSAAIKLIHRWRKREA